MNHNTLNQTPSQAKPQSFSGIQMAGGAFLLLIIAILAVNIGISNSIKQDSVEINLAGRQRMLSQRMAKVAGLIDDSERQGNSEKVAQYQKELQVTHNLFNSTLYGFLEGGDALDASGDEIELSRVDDEKLRSDLLEAVDIWESFADELQFLSRVRPGDLPEETLASVREALSTHNLTLLRLMNNLTVGLEKASSKKSSTLQLILAIALVLEVANFAYIIIHSVNNLKKGDALLQQYSHSLEENNQNLADSNVQLERTQAELQNANGSLHDAFSSLQQYSEEAETRANELQILSGDLNRLKEESDTIFQSVDHGLCLIDRDYQIGRRISKTMYEIFETEHLSGMSFLDLMRPLITQKDIQTLENYLKLQFNGKTMTKQLDKFNPLKQVEITLNWDGRSFTNKHVGFEFERVMEEGEVVDVLVTVTDVTETVALENKLKKASEDQSRKTSLILEIIHSNSSELELFLSQTEKSLDEINETLRGQGIEENSDQHIAAKVDLIEAIFRKIHNIKGNASMLGLQTVTDISHSIEEDLGKLRGREEITGDEFLGALVQMASLRERLNDYSEITQTILKDFSGGSRVPSAPVVLSRSERLAADLSGFADDIAKDCGKSVFVRSSVDVEEFSDSSYQTLKDILVQLTRNSVLHGIESSEARKVAGKLEDGIIQVKSRINADAKNILGEPAYEFTFRDDGAGLDLEKIRSTAVTKGLMSEGEAAGAAPSALAKLIFSPGFSTADAVSEHGGRGSGMDVVKDKILRDLGGKMSMSYAVGQYMQLSWLVPCSVVRGATETGKLSA